MGVVEGIGLGVAKGTGTEKVLILSRFAAVVICIDLLDVAVGVHFVAATPWSEVVTIAVEAGHRASGKDSDVSTVLLWKALQSAE